MIQENSDTLNEETLYVLLVVLSLLNITKQNKLPGGLGGVYLM